MEKFILRDRTLNHQFDELHPKYLKKYCEGELSGPRNDPIVQFLTEAPPSHEQILEKCLERQEKDQYRSKLSCIDWPSSSTTAASTCKQIEFTRMFRKTTKLKLRPSRDHLRKSLPSSKTAPPWRSSQFTAPLIYKKTSPPIGYYQASYNQVHRKSPGVKLAATAKSHCRKPRNKELQELSIKYDLVQPRPLTFNMGKQRSRERSQSPTKQPNEHDIPDVRSLELEFEFNARQQKKYPMRIPEPLFRLQLSGNRVPLSPTEINNVNLEMLRKYNFQSDKKFLYFKKLVSG